MLCEYGCGKEAKHQFKNGKWCCESNFRKCSKVKNQHSIKMTGKTHTLETRQKLRQSKIGISLNNKHRLNISNGLKGRSLSKDHKLKLKLFHTGKKRSNETKLNITKSKLFSINKIKNKYPTFSKEEEMRYDPKNLNNIEIQVHCKNHNCPNSKEQGGWFTPTRTLLFERIYVIEKTDMRNGYGNSYLYCSDKCKHECPLYNVYTDPNKKTNKSYTYEEYHTWRQEVLKRANNECEYCGEKANHAHHSRPQKLEPFHSLDPDFGIACCEKCHYEKGHKDECSTGNLSNIVC